MKAERDIRCSGCARLLCRMRDGELGCTIVIKCPRCGAFNHLRPPSPQPERRDRRTEAGADDPGHEFTR
jgi:phage FluMu protein Com